MKWALEISIVAFRCIKNEMLLEISKTFSSLNSERKQRHLLSAWKSLTNCDMNSFENSWNDELI